MLQLSLALTRYAPVENFNLHPNFVSVIHQNISHTPTTDVVAEALAVAKAYRNTE